MILIEPDHTLAYANEAALAMHGVAELSDLGATGEVGIRKDATQRTETVSDKVRHTEVEVEDGRVTVSRTGTTGTTTETTPRKPV